GLVPGLLEMLEGLVDSIGDLLSDLLGVLSGNGCTTGFLGIPGGNADGCKAILRDVLNENQGGGVTTGLLAPVLQLLDLLRPVLNGVGENLLQPLLEDLLGESPGRADVFLQSLQCDAAAIVY